MKYVNRKHNKRKRQARVAKLVAPWLVVSDLKPRPGKISRTNFHIV